VASVEHACGDHARGVTQEDRNTSHRTRCGQCRRFARLLPDETQCASCRGVLPLDFTASAREVR
jgi:rRNA maturation endonuclease Nob1